VLLNDIKLSLAKRAAENICDEGGRCIGVGGDIADVQVVQDLVARAVADFGRLTIAVANAGLSLWDDFFDFKPEDLPGALMCHEHSMAIPLHNKMSDSDYEYVVKTLKDF
jgi:3-oxoacyl-[acyl-carrier protein] reductase